MCFMETTQTASATDNVEYPNLADRVQSTFIDTMFIVFLMFVFASILDPYENVPDGVRVALFVGLWLIYEPTCTAIGFTIGNYIKGIRVRHYTDTSKRINFLQAFIRYLLKAALGWLSFITIHSNIQKRAIHDMAAGSVMINYKKN